MITFAIILFIYYKKLQSLKFLKSLTVKYFNICIQEFYELSY